MEGLGERLFPVLFDAVREPALALDAEGRILAANPAMEALLRAPARRVLGRAVSELCADPLDGHGLLAAVAGRRRLSDGGETLRLAGPTRPAFEVRARLVAAPDAGPEGARLLLLEADPPRAYPAPNPAPPLRERCASDARTLRGTGAKSADSGARAPDGLRDGAYVLDLAEAACRLSGLAADLVGPGAAADGSAPLAAFLDAIHPDDRDALAEAARAAGPEPLAVVRAETRMRRPGAEWRRIRHRAWVAARDGEGRPRRLAGVMSDAGPAEPPAARAARALQATAWEYDFDAGAGRVWRPGAGAPDPLDASAWRERVHPDDADRVWAAFHGLQFGGRFDEVYRERAPDGRWRWRHAAGGWLPKSRRAAGLVRDISAQIGGRREGEEAETAASAPSLVEAVRSAQASAWSYDFAERRLHVSGPVARLLGLPANGAFLHWTEWEARIHPDDVERMRVATAELASGRTFEVDYRIRGADEAYAWLNLRGAVSERDAEGAPTRASGFYTEVSARKALEERLADSERRLRTALENAREGAWTLDMPRGRVRFFGAARTLAGGDVGDDGLTLEAWRERIHPDDVHQCVEGVAAMAEGGALDCVYRLADGAGGWSWVHDRGRVSERDAEGRPLVAHGVLADVTERKTLEEELKRYAAELERTNRELDRFATVASHDLQEPLRKISAFASLLRRRYEGALDSEADRSLDYLVDAAGRMRRLIDDLLAYSRASKRAMRMKPVDLRGVAEAALAELDLALSEAAARVSLGDLPTVPGDETLLRLLLQNLVSNAVKYRRGPRPLVEIEARREGAGWRVTVRDDGIGMEPRFAEKIFAPFARLHPREAYDGTGIGLAICQQAVERHGGRIWVETAPGDGSAFHFTLPADARSADAA